MEKETLTDQVYNLVRSYIREQKYFPEYELLGKLGTRLAIEIAGSYESSARRDRVFPHSIEATEDLIIAAENYKHCPDLKDKAPPLFLEVAESYHALAHKGIQLKINLDLHTESLTYYLKAESYQQAVEVSLEILAQEEPSIFTEEASETIGRYGSVEDQNKALRLIEEEAKKILVGEDAKSDFGCPLQKITKAYYLAGGELSALDQLIVNLVTDSKTNLQNLRLFRKEIYDKIKSGNMRDCMYMDDEILWSIAKELSSKNRLDRMEKLGESPEKWEDRLEKRVTPYLWMKEKCRQREYAETHHWSEKEQEDNLIQKIMQRLPTYIPTGEAEKCLKEMISS